MRFAIVTPDDWKRFAPCGKCGVVSGPCLRLDNQRGSEVWTTKPHRERRVNPELRANVVRRHKACLCCKRTRDQLPTLGLRNRGLIRGLCETCYKRVQNRGELDRYPRLMRRAADTAEDYAELLEVGEVRCYREGALRLGVSYEALIKAVGRHRPDLLVKRVAA